MTKHKMYISVFLFMAVVVDVTTMSAGPPRSQGLGHAGKPYTLHREVHGMGPHMCHAGNTDSASYQTAFLPSPHHHHHHRRTAAAQ